MSQFSAFASPPAASGSGPAHIPIRVGDRADALPPKARDMLLNLREKAQELHAPLDRLHDEQHQLRIDIARHQAHLVLSKADLGRAPGAAEAVAADERAIDALRDRLDRSTARIERITATWRPVRSLVHNLDRYAARIAGRSMADAELPEVGLRKGENYETAVENRRRRLRELAADIRKIEVAPLPAAVVKERARAEIEALAVRGRPDLLGAVEFGEKIRWPKSKVNFNFDPKVGPIFGDTVDPLGLVAFVFRDSLIEKVNAEIDAMANDAESIEPASKPSMIATVKRDAPAVEFDIEALIRQAAEQGIEIARDEAADPRAVLALAGDLPEPKQD